MRKKGSITTNHILPGVCKVSVLTSAKSSLRQLKILSEMIMDLTENEEQMSIVDDSFSFLVN